MSPGPDPRPPQRVVDAEPREVALEPLGRLLVLEVGLDGDPLDPLAADDEHVVVALHREPVAGRLEPVDDHAGRLGARIEPVGVGQQIEGLASAGSPSPVSAEIARTVDLAPTRGRSRNAGHASPTPGRSSLLNATSIGFSSSAGSCASSSSRITS